MADRSKQTFQRSTVGLGVAFGGFFDGIVLHQILGWHHLLSAVKLPGASSLQFQVMADGVFHAVMYVVLGASLVGLWRHRGALLSPDAGPTVAPGFLMGFGGWHVADAVLSHWLLGLHRIRMDVSNPLAWDIGWVAIFGLVPLAVGWLMRRRATGGPGPSSSIGLASALLITLTGALWSSMPLDADGRRLVVLAGSASPGQLFRGMAGHDTRVIGSDASGQVWMVGGADLAAVLSLYQHGALYVSGTLSPADCGTWSSFQKPLLPR